MQTIVNNDDRERMERACLISCLLMTFKTHVRVGVIAEIHLPFILSSHARRPLQLLLHHHFFLTPSSSSLAPTKSTSSKQSLSPQHKRPRCAGQATGATPPTPTSGSKTVLAFTIPTTTIQMPIPSNATMVVVATALLVGLTGLLPRSESKDQR